MRKTLTLCLAALALVVLAGCSRQQPELVGSQSDGVARNVVLISHMSFIPRVLTVTAGTTVTWQWDDGPTPHDVTFTGGNLDLTSGAKHVGTFSHTFDTPGTYTYICTLHYNMRGEIVVKAAGS